MIGPLSYIGGKRRIAKRLLPLLPEHITYVEPFAGGAQLFFHKPRSPIEVLNDVDGEVVNFFKVCQRHPAELARTLRFQPASRAVFAQHRDQSPHLLTDIERAARFYYLQKNAFGGRRRRQNFHYGVTKPSSYQPAALPARLMAVADRLIDVQLESTPYEEVLVRYDRPTTFFYCDPPYVGLPYYRFNFATDDYVALAERLARLRGRFLLSINDHPTARTAFKRFHQAALPVAYPMGPKGRRRVELVFANFPLPHSLNALRHVV